MNRTILSTVKNSGAYYFLISAVEIYLKKENKKNYEITLFEKKKFFLPFLFLIKNFFIFIFFNPVKVMNIRYNGYRIGRYTVPIIFKNYNSYLSKKSLIINTMKCFYKTCCIVESSKNYLKNKKIESIFVDHCMYENGIIMEIFLDNKIKVFSLGYPKGIFSIENKNKKEISYEDVIKLNKKKKLTNKEKIKVRKILNRITNNTEKIPWMRNINFKKNKNQDYEDITHIIYLHSFTDAQLLYGFDGFLNVYDWIQFTIEELIKDKKNKILIKAHPSIFHTKFPSDYIKYDQKICNELLEKYSKEKNVKFLISPIKNIDILKMVNKKCILISHHGSAILEGLYCGFKCISSTATFWNKKLQLTNSWNNKKEYKILLKRKWYDLKYCKNEDFYNVSYQLYCNESGLYGKNYWQQIISKKLKINRADLYQNPKKILNKLLNKINQKTIDLIQKNISKTIELIQF